MSAVATAAGTYTSKAYRLAGISPGEWLPEKGYRYNRALLYRLYDYYQQLYFRNPGQFLWAGLARMTGGQVLYGMEKLTRFAKDPCVLTTGIMTAAKAIFEGIAWQHELMLEDSQALLLACSRLDETAPAVHPYRHCWQLILNGTTAGAADGNKLLLRNEQEHTIQPHYNTIKKDACSAKWFFLTRFVMRNIHPHHRRFIFCQPFGDVTIIEDRWRWIDGPKGMWQTWCGLTLQERNRLVALDTEDIIRHRW